MPQNKNVFRADFHHSISQKVVYGGLVLVPCDQQVMDHWLLNASMSP